MREKEIVISIIIICTLFIILLMGFITVILLLYQKKQNLFTIKLETIKTNYDKELLKTQLEIQEETFQYISREIHDNIGQFISLAKLQLNTLDLADSGRSARSVTETVDLLTQALDELRNLSRSLSTEVIRSAGLPAVIGQLVTQLQKLAIADISFEIRGDYVFLDEQEEIFIFRIFQEAINNIIRHSEASKVAILLLYDENNLMLTVRDNGKGFDTNSISRQKNTSGLNNMMKRAKMINAAFHIQSSIHSGTCINITVPY